MPIYEYYCKVCESKFEVIQKISEQPIKKCEKCKKVGKVVKLLSAPGFRLKGSGWYETDFKFKNKKNLYEKDKQKYQKEVKEKNEK